MKKALFIIFILLLVSCILSSCQDTTVTVEQGKDHSPLPCADSDNDSKCDVCGKTVLDNSGTSNNPDTNNNNNNDSTGSTETDSPSKYQEYYITFNCNGGNTLNTVKATKDDCVIQTSPTTYKNGYEFQGWYSSPDFREDAKIDFPYTITSSQTWYAKWGTITNYQDFHTSISWSATTAFDMTNDQRLGVGKNITVPNGVKTIYLKGNYGTDSSHIYSDLSFTVQSRNDSIQFILENFAFISNADTPAISADGVDVIITLNGVSNMIKGASGQSGSAGKDGSNSSKSPSGGAAGENGKDGSIAVVCKNLRISGSATISLIGGNGGDGANGGKGGDITSTSYTGVPSCGSGGNGGNGGNGASSINVAELNVECDKVNFIAGNGGNAGDGGNGGTGRFDLIHWCNGGNGGKGGKGGNSDSPVKVEKDISVATYFKFQGEAGIGGIGGNGGRGNGNNYPTAVDNRTGKNGSNGENGTVFP